MKLGELTRLLKQSGSQYVSEETMRADIAAGLPVNGNGTVNLIMLAAWLVREGTN